jgi:hypothetical protein
MLLRPLRRRPAPPLSAQDAAALARAQTLVGRIRDMALDDLIPLNAAWFAAWGHDTPRRSLPVEADIARTLPQADKVASAAFFAADPAIFAETRLEMPSTHREFFGLMAACADTALAVAARHHLDPADYATLTAPWRSTFGSAALCEDDD